MTKKTFTVPEINGEALRVRKEALKIKENARKISATLRNPVPALEIFNVLAIPDAIVSALCGVARSTVSAWRVGTNQPEPFMLAVLLEVSAMFVRDFIGTGFAEFEGHEGEQDAVFQKTKDYLEALQELQFQLVEKLPASAKMRAYEHTEKLKKEQIED